jgi:uncharacterized membrane protein (DUF2068 family)
MAKCQSTPALLAIALFKLFEGVALIAVGIGALKLLRQDVSEPIGIHIPDVTPKQLEAASAGTFIYAALLLTEGTGLLLCQHWAEYFTVITPAGLIPLELY